MDRLTRHPLLQDIPLETVVDYTVDFIRIVGVPPSFLENTAIVDIHNYRGQLPCDFYKMIQVRLHRGKCRHMDDDLGVFKYATDSFHMSDNHKRRTELTYKIQDNVIFTSILEDGQIEIAYRSIPVDEDGYPLLPDSSSYLKALELYIKQQWFTIQFDMGKINAQVLQKTDQEYTWAVGQAQTDLIMPSIDQMESISNMWNTLLDRRTEHSRGFLNTEFKERLRVH